jgi:hypothetical protein
VDFNLLNYQFFSPLMRGRTTGDELIFEDINVIEYTRCYVTEHQSSDAKPAKNAGQNGS